MAGEPPLAPRFPDRSDDLRRRVHPHAGQCRPGSHDRRANACSLELHSHLTPHCLAPGLRRVVRTHEWTLALGTLRADPYEVTALSLPHTGETTNRTPTRQTDGTGKRGTE